MTRTKFFLTIIYTLIFSFIVNAQVKDISGDQKPSFVPENIQYLLNQIKSAENNEDWDSYYQLREKIIQAWQIADPEVAKLYRNVNDGTPDASADGISPIGKSKNETESFYNISEDSPSKSNMLWGTDKLIFSGRANDISMDISRIGEIYIAISGRYDGSTTKDTVYILKSTDQGLSWIEWSKISATTQNFKQVELMLFDGQIGGSGTQNSYILLFYLFDNGWLRVGRTKTSSPAWSFYTLAGSDAGGPVTKFAVDRNNTPSNYRAFCMYDSIIGSNALLKVIRSEPSSYGTIWQDDHSLGYLGRDLDFCYGWNGAVYASFNGASSGNLYVRENTNFADPSSWLPIETLTDGTTDTTRHGQIIASRDNLPDNIVSLIFERQTGTSYDLYWVSRPPNVGWDTLQSWVLPDENKLPALYSRRTSGNRVFRSVFERSLINNASPRSIRYKEFDGISWSGSEQVSDASNDVTGLQKPEVADIDGNTPVFAYVGENYTNVYFDNINWTPSDINEISVVIPNEFSLEQNYPNPFNPITTISFVIGHSSFVSLKIYNVLGKEVANLVNEEKNAGKYSVKFNAENLPSGIYFYKLVAGNPSTGSGQVFTETKKMILLK